jgi:hypothetical protein
MAALTFSARPAAAYVRYRTATATACPYFWRSRSLNITGYPRGLADIPVETAGMAINQAVDAWTKRDAALGGCTDLDLKVTLKAETDVAPAAKYDRRNNITFRTQNWCDLMDDGTCGMQHEPAALAITSVFAHKLYGEILDADVEVNGVNFVWGDLVTTPDPTRQDLQNALTHEMGHFIGLDHTCLLGGGTPPKDQNGDPIPTCLKASADVAATTMFASAQPGDVSKRTLEADDRAAVCAIYPAGAPDPLACTPPPDDSGCSVAPAPATKGSGAIGSAGAGWIAGVGAAAALAAAIWRRTRRRKHGRS